MTATVLGQTADCKVGATMVSTTGVWIFCDIATMAISLQRHCDVGR